MTRPFSSCCFMRTASVLVPRKISQHSKGDRIAPAAFWMNASFSACSAVVHTSTPPSAVAVAVEKLGRRVHHDVGAKLDGLLKIRRHEGVVDHHLAAALVRDRG